MEAVASFLKGSLTIVMENTDFLVYEYLLRSGANPKERVWSLWEVRQMISCQSNLP